MTKRKLDFLININDVDVAAKNTEHDKIVFGSESHKIGRTFGIIYIYSSIHVTLVIECKEKQTIYLDVVVALLYKGLS
jgi:hypothetical protein